MTTPNNTPSPLEVSQQELGAWISNESDPDANSVYGLARACVPHTLAAMTELAQGQHKDHLSQLVAFLKDYGVFDEADHDTEYFQKNRGWLLLPIADLIRLKGSRVVVQNLIYGTEADIADARTTGRVRSAEEKDILSTRMMHGGEDKTKWVNAIDETLSDNGFAMPIIQIPRMDGKGKSGHSVLVLSHDDGMVEYFDSDENAVSRYTENGLPIPAITRVEGQKRLYYRQPEKEFCERMSGELMHIFHN